MVAAAHAIDLLQKAERANAAGLVGRNVDENIAHEHLENFYLFFFLHRKSGRKKDQVRAAMMATKINENNKSKDMMFAPCLFVANLANQRTSAFTTVI